MPQFHAMTAPYEVYLAATGQAYFEYADDEADLTSKPAAPWVKFDDGEIDQNPVKITWGATKEKEPPAQNEAFSRRVYIPERMFSITFTMKNVGAKAIAQMLDNATLTENVRSATEHGSQRFEYGESDPYYWALCLIGSNERVPNEGKLPSSTINGAMMYYDGSVEIETSRTSPAMVEVTFEGLKAIDDRISAMKNITQRMGT